MRLGIVGSERRKFTEAGMHKAQQRIRELIETKTPEIVISGGCHLGGIDLWAAEIADHEYGIKVVEYLPATRTWPGYKDRNVLIAQGSDEVVCLTVRELPPEFKEGGWERYCYHCKTPDHIKSGGCWTTKYARGLGKPGWTEVIDANN